MNKIVLYFAFLAALFAACNNGTHSTAENKNTHEVSTADTIAKRQLPVASEVQSIDNGDSLIYQKDSFSSYTDKIKRGAGIVSINLDVDDRLDILNLDDSKFGEIVLNDDFTFFTLNMPKKVIARKVVPEYDFAAFDFDAESVATDKDYLIIYVNKEQRKVKKSEVNFTFRYWK